MPKIRIRVKPEGSWYLEGGIKVLGVQVRLYFLIWVLYMHRY